MGSSSQNEIESPGTPVNDRTWPMFRCGWVLQALICCRHTPCIRKTEFDISEFYCILVSFVNII